MNRQNNEKTQIKMIEGEKRKKGKAEG